MSGFLKRGRSKLKSGLLQVTHVATSVASSRSPSPHVPGASHSQGSHTPQRSASKQTRSQRTAELGRTAYDGLNLIVQSLYDCSDIFLPLKTAAGVFLAITGVVERVSANKKELDELELRLKSILSIVQTYKGLGGMRELQSRIEKFCEDIENQMKSVENMKNHPVLVRSAESTTDADKIAKAFRNMNILCEMFQMDTQANITVNVAEIIRLLKTGSLDRLNYKTSYKTRQSPYGDPTSCMPGTRVQILDDLVTWASHEGPKVYWMVGMAGTGKSTIAQTFCERLDEKNMLGASFFCSRASDNANDARLIIPAIAHSLASTSPAIKSQVIKAIEDEPALAEPTYIKMDVQFNELIAQPIRITVGAADKRYKVIVIDAVDECRDLRRVASLIRLFLASVSQIPLRIFIASRDEYLIRQAFNTYTAEEFHLHEVDKNVVKDDIAMYVKALLHQVHEDNGNDSGETWPPESELSALLHQSSTLFIYAATAIRYILDGEALYKSRLTALTQETKSGGKQMLGIDGLYALILEQACHDWEEHEIKRMRDVMSLVIFFRTPLSIEAISSLSRLDASQYLSRLTSVIHVPSRKQSSITVTPLHTSFPEFVTDYTRCSPACCPTFTVLVAAECHELLAVKCLELMNRLLEYNVAKVPEELTMPRGERKNSPQYIDSIPEVLKYSCIHWVSHLMEVQMPCTELITALLTFFRTHLLQWIECMTVLCKSLMVPKSLTGVATTLTFSGWQSLKGTDTRCGELYQIVEESRKSLQRSVVSIEAAVQHAQEALDLTPMDHPDRVARLHSLAAAFGYRYHGIDDLKDLEASLQMDQEALDLTPMDHPDRAEYLHSLAISFRDRYRRLGDLMDLEAALQSGLECVQLTPEDHPRWPGSLQNLASLFGDRHRRLGDDKDLQQVHTYYTALFGISALEHVESSWAAALDWASFSEEFQPSHVATAYQAAFHLLPEILCMEAVIPGRHNAIHRLHMHRLLHVGQATSAATRSYIGLSQLTSAVEILEQGLETMMQQMLQLKPDMNKISPKQADDLKKFSWELYNGSAINPREVEAKRKDLLDNIHKQPGLEHFLLPRPYKVLSHASQGGPVVILNSHSRGCDGIIIPNPVSDPVHVPLPNVTLELLKFQQNALKQLLNHCNVGTRGFPMSTRLFGHREGFMFTTIEQQFIDLLTWLWKNVVEPVYQVLASHDIHNGRLWWLPSGSFTGLPFHACPPTDQFIHSYTATLGSLLEARSKKPSNVQHKIGVVGVTHTGLHRANYLKQVKPEVEQICSIFKDHNLECLMGEKATPTAVKNQLQNCSWVHLACHGVQDLKDPIKSRLLLYDGELDLETILQISFSDAEFVFLAACQTAMGDANFLNESFHLAGGFIAAGFQSAIGTLWPMNDQDGPLVAESVYSHLFRDGRQPQASDAAEALQLAVNKLRAEKVPYERWVPFIHMGV